MSIFNLLTNGAKLWLHSDMKSYAAAFSYYAPLAIIPLILFSITMVGVIYGEDTTRQILTDWAGMLSQDIVNLINDALTNLRKETQSFGWPVAGLLLFLGISILALNSLANGFYRLRNNQQYGVRNWFIKSARSFLFILIFQFYLAVVIGFELFIIAFDLRSDYLISTFFLFISTTAFFTILFRFLASQAPSFKGCLVGGSIVSLLFIITKSTVIAYIDNVADINIYGAAGLILVLLSWIYILSSLIYYGASIASEYDKIKPIND